jgi:hypothetical protein
MISAKDLASTTRESDLVQRDIFRADTTQVVCLTKRVDLSANEGNVLCEFSGNNHAKNNDFASAKSSEVKAAVTREQVCGTPRAIAFQRPLAITWAKSKSTPYIHPAKLSRCINLPSISFCGIPLMFCIPYSS